MQILPETHIEISKQALLSNIEFFQSLLSPETELKLVVKSNAYGHGVKEIVTIAYKANVKSFAVHSLTEAIEVQEYAPQADILIMGPVLMGNLPIVIQLGFQISLFNYEHLLEFNRLTREMKKPLRLHIKAETGTNRLGINLRQLDRFIDVIEKNEYLILESVYTHYSNIEDTTDHSYAIHQLERFVKFKERINERGISSLKPHTACSAAILLFPDTHFNIVRLGLSLYGHWSSKETFVSYKILNPHYSEDALKPVLTWKTKIGQIKTVAKGEYIGYGCTYRVSRESTIAVLPLGYNEGLNRKLSNNAYFLVKGQRAPVRGRICMNLTMIDVTDIPGVKLEDEVILIGKSGDDAVTAEDWASWIGTINYEVLTSIKREIPRVITE